MPIKRKKIRIVINPKARAAEMKNSWRSLTKNKWSRDSTSILELLHGIKKARVNWEKGLEFLFPPTLFWRVHITSTILQLKRSIKTWSFIQEHMEKFLQALQLRISFSLKIITWISQLLMSMHFSNLKRKLMLEILFHFKGIFSIRRMCLWPCLGILKKTTQKIGKKLWFFNLDKQMNKEYSILIYKKDKYFIISRLKRELMELQYWRQMRTDF